MKYFDDLKLPTPQDPRPDYLPAITLRIQSLQTDITAAQTRTLAAVAAVVACKNQEPADPTIAELFRQASADAEYMAGTLVQYNAIITQWGKTLAYTGRSLDKAFFTDMGTILGNAATLASRANETADDAESLAASAASAVTADEDAKAKAAQQIAQAVADNAQAVKDSAGATSKLADAVETLNNDQPIPDPLVQQSVNDARQGVDSATTGVTTVQADLAQYQDSLADAHFTPADMARATGGTEKKPLSPLVLAAGVALALLLL